MLLLLLVFVVVGYHGLVWFLASWAAKRVSHNAARIAIKTVVVFAGLTLFWFDQLYVRFVIMGHYCEVDKDKLGFHEYAPVVVKADQVMWADEKKPGVAKEVIAANRTKIRDEASTPEVPYPYWKSNALGCVDKTGGRYACIVDGYVNASITEPPRMEIFGVNLGRVSRVQLLYNEQIVRELRSYSWEGSWFLRKVIGMNLPLLYTQLRCGPEKRDYSELFRKVSEVKVQE